MSNISKVSILIPIYNVEKYLDECLSSVVNQSLKNIEIICINDGSTDGSLEIIQKYMQNDPRVKLINKPNSGYGDSMNQGLKVASGQYIGIVESDDIAKKDMFKTLYNIAKKQNYPDIIKSNYFEYWTNNNVLQLKNNLPKKLCNYVFKPLKKPNIFKSAPSIWSAIYKNSFLKTHNIDFLPTQGASYQDTSFNFKSLYFASSIYCTSKAFLKYRQDNNNSSVNNKEKVFCICDEYEEIEKIVSTKFKPILLATKFNSYLWNYNRLDRQYKKIFLKKFKDEFLKDKKYIIKKLFVKNRYKLVMALLKSIKEFQDKLNKIQIDYLDKKSKKLLSKIKSYKNKSFILYGFNNIAKSLINTSNIKISFIVDRNPLEKEFNNIPICTIDTLKTSDYKQEVFIITAINPVFIEEIKKVILQKFPKSKIISL